MSSIKKFFQIKLLFCFFFKLLKDIKGFCLKFIIKFLPSICVLVVFHFLSLYFKCKEENNFKMALESSIANNSTVTTTATQHHFTNATETKYKCHLFAFDLFSLKLNSATSYNYWSNNQSVQFSQLFNHFFLSIYFGT